MDTDAIDSEILRTVQDAAGCSCLDLLLAVGGSGLEMFLRLGVLLESGALREVAGRFWMPGRMPDFVGSER